MLLKGLVSWCLPFPMALPFFLPLPKSILILEGRLDEDIPFRGEDFKVSLIA